MKKTAFLALLSISASLFSQNVIGTSTAPENKWTFGGGIGFGFGSNSTFNLQASPRVGYRITDNIEGGITGTVMWQTSDYFNSTMFGVGPFVNYYFARSFYLSGNLQQFFINYKDKYYDFSASDEETALYLGGGYLQRMGKNSYLQLGLMYNVLYSSNNSNFSSGLIPTVGFVVGL